MVVVVVVEEAAVGEAAAAGVGEAGAVTTDPSGDLGFDFAMSKEKERWIEDGFLSLSVRSWWWGVGKWGGGRAMEQEVKVCKRKRRAVVSHG